MLSAEMSASVILRHAVPSLLLSELFLGELGIVAATRASAHRMLQGVRVLAFAARHRKKNQPGLMNSPSAQRF